MNNFMPYSCLWSHLTNNHLIFCPHSDLLCACMLVCVYTFMHICVGIPSENTCHGYPTNCTCIIFFNFHVLVQSDTEKSWQALTGCWNLSQHAMCERQVTPSKSHRAKAQTDWELHTYSKKLDWVQIPWRNPPCHPDTNKMLTMHHQTCYMSCAWARPTFPTFLPLMPLQRPFLQQCVGPFCPLIWISAHNILSKSSLHTHSCS